jgi:TrmH family RNA methyltransferase
MTGRHNQRVKLLRRLGRRKYREEEGLFLVEGLRFVEEALSSGWLVELVACAEKATVSPRGKALLQAAEAASLPVMEVDEKLLAELADTKTPQGVLAVVRQKQVRLCDFLSPGKIPLLLVVDGVQDPGNLGAIIRTADAAGAGGVLLLKGTVDLYNPKLSVPRWVRFFTSRSCRGWSRRRSRNSWLARESGCFPGSRAPKNPCMR